MVACLIVTGITVYGIVAGDSSDKTAEYGDKVEVEYTGSYFTYYNEEGALIFDTNMEEVGNDNEKYPKSYGYSSSDTYSTLQFVVGEGTIITDSSKKVLDGFKEALIGHKPGDIVTVKIVDGYGSLIENDNKFTVAKSGTPAETILKVQTMTVDAYKSLFGVDSVPTAPQYNVDSPYGWKANVTPISGDMVTVEYIPEDDTAYTKNEVTYKVIGAVTDTITFQYQMDDFAENAKLLKGVYGGQVVYFIKSDGANMTYKNTAETVGTTMYFTIKFVGYLSS